MAKQFKLLIENFLNRGNNGGFAIRDIVKFTKNYKTSEHFKKLHDNIKKIINQFVSEDKPIRVLDIKTAETIPGNSINNAGARGHEVWIEIAQEYAPGRTDNSKSILVHPELLEIIESGYPNLPKIPDSYYHKSKEYIQDLSDENEESDVFTQTRQADVNGVRKNSETILQNKNIKIPTVKNKVKSNIVSKNIKIQENHNIMDDYLDILYK